jgi:hypothetical protein
MDPNALDSNLYVVDTHFGDEENLERDRRAEKLKEFLDLYSLRVNEVILGGDTTREKWKHVWEGKNEKEITKMGEKYAKPQLQNFFNQIFAEHEGKITSFVGNHELDVVSNPTEETARESVSNAEKDLEDFLKNNVFKDKEFDISVLSGAQQVEEGVIVEHGNYADIAGLIRSIFKDFDPNMSTEEKLQLLNDHPEINTSMQTQWNKWRKMLWPMLREYPEESEAIFSFLSMLNEFKSAFNRVKKITENLNGSHSDHALLQTELLQALAGEDKYVMVSGHRHLKSTNHKKNVLSISLGEWEGESIPTTALHIPPKTENDKDRWIILEFAEEQDAWVPLKEYTFDKEKNEWEEQFGTELRPLTELSEEEWEKEYSHIQHEENWEQ